MNGIQVPQQVFGCTYRSLFKTNPNLYNAHIFLRENPSKSPFASSLILPQMGSFNDPWPSQEKLPGLNSKVWREDFTPINGRNGMGNWGNWGNTPYKWSYGALNFKCLYVTLRHPSLPSLPSVRFGMNEPRKKHTDWSHTETKHFRRYDSLDVWDWFQGGVYKVEPEPLVVYVKLCHPFFMVEHSPRASLGVIFTQIFVEFMGPPIIPYL